MKKIYLFSAPWCNPCATLKKLLLEMNIKGIYHIDVESEPRMAELYSIRALPTIVMVEDEKETHRIVGLKSKKEYEALFESVS